MPSLRTRITALCALATLTTVALFAVSVYVALKSATYSDLENRGQVRADAAWRLLRRSLVSGGLTITGDTVGGLQRIGITPQAREMLDVLTGPYLMVNKNGLVYASPNLKRLWDQQDSSLTVPLGALRSGRRSLIAPLDGTRYLLVQRGVSDSDFGDLTIVVGADVTPLDRAPLEVIGAALLALPIIAGISIGAGYIISQRATRPLASVDSITTEVAAITDGRSLHRRLAVDETSEELARLTLQLNSMIGRLERSFAGLRRFTADASHELKTPLAVLRADVERAMHAQTSSHEQLVALEEALQETTRMADLVESLLTLARADEGRFDLHREPVPLVPLVKDVFETALILGEHGGLKVTLPVLHDGTVMGDRKRLRQLFLNLVTNALKYTNRGGEVELSLARLDDDVSFSVRDTGMGISAADLPHVFERFWRADRARSRVGERGGFGLGLAIGQWIAQAHGGTLTVQSRLHRGSTFTVTLPVGSAETLAESRVEESAEIRAAS